MLWLPWLIGGVYLVAWLHLRRRGWPRRRLWCAVAAVALLGWGCSAAVMHHAHHDYRWHMGQHLVLGMLAPLLLVCAAPATLLLRALPPGPARWLVWLWHRSPLRWLWHPVPASLLHIGGMYALYLTPLFAWSLASPAGHLLVHLHFFLAGYLYCQAILAGPDRIPALASRRLRGLMLWLSVGLHAFLGKWMYAGPWPRGTPFSEEHLREGAMLMYYGGDLLELLLIGLFFAAPYWRGAGRMTGNHAPLVGPVTALAVHAATLMPRRRRGGATRPP